jgi:FKBP-type peptidyl-prolyl cis-trans isomerase 2
MSFLPAIVRNTFADATGIAVGTVLTIDAGKPVEETTTVTEIFENAVYAEYTHPHADGFTVTGTGVGGHVINTVSTTGFTGVTITPQQQACEIEQGGEDAQPEVDPVTGFGGYAPETTMRESDFPGLSLESPMVSNEEGALENPIGNQITAGEVHD